jgi:hypothetical protein
MLPTWLASVDPLWFAVTVVVLSTLSFLCLACLAWGGRIQAREIARLTGDMNRVTSDLRHELSVLTGDVVLAAVQVDEVAEDLRKQKARIDRMQRNEERRGWGDSLDLTKFDWRRKGPF